MKKHLLPALVVLTGVVKTAVPTRAQTLTAVHKSTSSIQERIFEDVPLYDWSYKALIQLNALSTKGGALPDDIKSSIHPMTRWEFAVVILRWGTAHPQTELTWQDVKARDIGEALKIEFAPDIEEVLIQDAQRHAPLFNLTERPLASDHAPYSRRSNNDKIISNSPSERK